MWLRGKSVIIAFQQVVKNQQAEGVFSTKAGDKNKEHLFHAVLIECSLTGIAEKNQGKFWHLAE